MRGQYEIPLSKTERLVAGALDRTLPHEWLPFGKRWRLAGSYNSPDTVTGLSLLKRGLPWFPGCNIYIHRIDQCDGDRALHNHPYNWGSWLLTGGYAQDVICADGAIRPKWVRPLEWNALKRHEYHRVKYLPNRAVWTVFVAGPAVFDSDGTHQWGFWVDGKHVPWKQYREMK